MGFWRWIELKMHGAVYCEDCNNKRGTDECHVAWATRHTSFIGNTDYKEVRVKRTERNGDGKCKYWIPYSYGGS